MEKRRKWSERTERSGGQRDMETEEGESEVRVRRRYPGFFRERNQENLRSKRKKGTNFLGSSSKSTHKSDLSCTFPFIIINTSSQLPELLN